MSSDEEDYMSDAILAQCGDNRPGLIRNNSKSRQLELDKKKAEQQNTQRQKHMPVKKREELHRETGLQTEIKSDNKGFAMLQKMGYQPGMSIGKKGDGIVVPIGIEIKDNRSGLGRSTDQELKRKAREEFRSVMSEKRKKMEELERGEYRHRIRRELESRHGRRDLRKSQKICEQLDREKGWEEPVTAWYWYREVDDEDDADAVDEDAREDESDAEVSYRLEALTGYLRQTYFYCIWCAVRYEDDADLLGNCPGDCDEDHR